MFQASAADEFFCITLGFSRKRGRPAERGTSNSLACRIVMFKCLREICLCSLQPQQEQQQQKVWGNHARRAWGKGFFLPNTARWRRLFCGAHGPEDAEQFEQVTCGNATVTVQIAHAIGIACVQALYFLIARVGSVVQG